MISAGYTPTLPAPPVAGTTLYPSEAGADKALGSYDMGKAQEWYQNAWSTSMWVGAGSELANNLINLWGSWLMGSLQSDTMKHISDNEKEAAFKIEDNRYSMLELVTKAQSESDERLNGPSGLNRHNANVSAALEDRKHAREIESKERMAALDRTFSVDNRYSYDYGSPSILG